MLEEVARLTHMVETLLTMSRADAGQITLHKARFSFMSLLHEITGLVGVLAEEKDQMITLTGDDSIVVDADQTFLGQAVINLLDNAVKYSPTGSEVRINLKKVQLNSPDKRLAELTIEDEGAGIPEEFRERVFDRFYRLDEARSREAGGAGLGLSIAKWVIAAHEGEIGIKPSPGDGCTFYLRIPLADSM
jgi:signal transduction histidine kinase